MAFERYNKYLYKMNQQGKTVPFMNYVKPSATNAFTGLEMKRGISTALGVGALAWGAMGSIKATYAPGVNENRAVDVGSLPGMAGDGLGNVTNGRRDLGASGDMVFGMYNARRGK